MKKKIAAIIFLALILLIAVYFIKWYRNSQNQKYPTTLLPRIELTVINIKEITKERTTMDEALLIKNPFPFTLNLDSINYVIYINQKSVVTSEYKKSIHLKGNDSTMITLPVVIKNEALIGILKKLEANHIDSADYTIEGKVFLKLPVLKDKYYKFNYTMRLPSLVIPDVKISKIKISRLGIKHTHLTFAAKINNPNVFSINFRHMKYRINLNKDTLATGEIDSLISIKAKSEVTINVPVDLSIKEAAGGVYDYILKSDNTTYFFWMSAVIVSEYNSIKNSKMIIENNGTLKEIKELQ
jgi:LEA14-like dessication related protein